MQSAVTRAHSRTVSFSVLEIVLLKKLPFSILCSKTTVTQVCPEALREEKSPYLNAQTVKTMVQLKMGSPSSVEVYIE